MFSQSPFSTTPFSSGAQPGTPPWAASLTGVCTVTSSLTAVSHFDAVLTGVCTVTASFTTSIALSASLAGLTTVSGTINPAMVARLFSTTSVLATLGGGAARNPYPPTPFPPLPHVLETEVKGHGQEGKTIQSQVWQNWMARLSKKVRDPGQLDWLQLSFTNSSLKDLNNRQHNDLQSIYGGAAGDIYHVTLVERDKINVDEVLLWLTF